MKRSNLHAIVIIIMAVFVGFTEQSIAQSFPSMAYLDESKFDNNDLATLAFEDTNEITTGSNKLELEISLKTELNSILGPNKILFNYRDYKLTGNSKEILDRVASFMKSNPTAVFRVSGHADTRGWYEDNLILSNKRADATVSYLIFLGVEPKQLNKVGVGEVNPINVCDSDSHCDETHHAINRRVEIDLIKAP